MKKEEWIIDDFLMAVHAIAKENEGNNNEEETVEQKD